MAQFVALRCRVNFRLLAGTNPETGRNIIRTVSVTRIDPSLLPAALKEVETLLSPMFEFPVAEVQRYRTDLVEDI